MASPGIPVDDDALLAALREALGDAGVLTGAAVAARARHVRDPRPLQALAVLRPGLTDDVSRALAVCHAAGRSVVTHGGLTGLAGGNDSDTSDTA